MALAEKVERSEPGRADALRIGKQVLQDNALGLYPRLKERLGKDKGPLKPRENEERPGRKWNRDAVSAKRGALIPLVPTKLSEKTPRF